MLKAQYHIAEHVDKTPVAIVGEPLVHFLCQSRYCFIVQSQVQYRIHHTRHGYPCT